MTDEVALKLIEALNRHTAAIEKMSGLNGLAGGGMHIYHHGVPQYQNPWRQPYAQPVYIGGGG